jgi:hypothetical protein
VSQIQVEFEADALRPLAQARVREKIWNLCPSKEANVLNLPITAEIKKAWKEKGSLELVCSQVGIEEMRLVFSAPAKRLNFSGDRVKMTIIQGQWKEVSGSEGYLGIYIGESAGGEALLSLVTAQGEAFIDQTPVRVGDQVPLAVGEEKYILAVEKLVNSVRGEDYAVFIICRLAPPEMDQSTEHKKIERLIDAIERSDAVFIRNDKEYPPKEAAEHIRKKYEYAREDIHTLEEFIDKVASRSWISGREYLVRLPDGTEVTARKWLHEQAARQK